MRTMLDALDPLNIPLGTPMDLLATYIDHAEIDSHGLGRARFPHTVDVTISAHVHAAHVLDVENFAASPSDVPHWMGLGSQCRTVYCTASTWQLVLDACLDSHVPPPMHWVAEWNNIADVPSGTVAHQYSDGPAGNPYDVSAVADFWPTVDAPPPPPQPVVVPEVEMFLLDSGTAQWLVSDSWAIDLLDPKNQASAPAGIPRWTFASGSDATAVVNAALSTALNLSALAAGQQTLQTLLSDLITAVGAIPTNAPAGTFTATVTPQGSTS